MTADVLQCMRCGGTNVEPGEPIWASTSGVNHNAPFVVGHTPHRCLDCHPR